MKFVLFACLSSTIIFFASAQNPNYCERLTCERIENANFRLDNATSRYGIISQLSQLVNDCTDYVKEAYNPWILRTQTDLATLHASIESFEWEEESEDVPLTLFQGLKLHKEATERLEERYDKLLRETELATSRTHALSEKIKRRENLLEDARNKLEGTMRQKFTLRQNLNRLINVKMSRREFELSKRRINFQLDRIGTKLLLISKTEDYNLKEETAESDNLNRTLSDLSEEVDHVRKSIGDVRTGLRQLDAVQRDLDKIEASLASDDLRPVRSKLSSKHHRNKNNNKDGGTLTIAQRITANKQSTKPKG